MPSASQRRSDTELPNDGQSDRVLYLLYVSQPTLGVLQ